MNNRKLLYLSLMIFLISVTGITYATSSYMKEEPINPTPTKSIGTTVGEDILYDKENAGYPGVLVFNFINIDSKLAVEAGKTYPLTLEIELIPMNENCTGATVSLDPAQGLRLSSFLGKKQVSLNKWIEYPIDKLYVVPGEVVHIKATLSVPSSTPLGELPLRVVGVDGDMPTFDKTEVEIIVVK